MFLDAISSQELSLGVISLPLSCQAQVVRWGSGIQIYCPGLLWTRHRPEHAPCAAGA